MSIAAKKVVSIAYTLKNAGGDVLDEADPEHPHLYLHGCENVVPGLERALEGRSVGETLEVVVAPADGYGERLEAEPQAIPKSSFPQGMPFEPGFPFAVQDEDGEPIQLFIERMEGDQVFVTPNHHLAGETLHYQVQVVAIRDATEEELTHGHPHGPTGHEGHHH